MLWKLYQVAIFTAFMCLNIHFHFVSGIAAPVLGGMLAWYSTGVLNAIIALLTERRLPPQHEGQLSSWERSVAVSKLGSRNRYQEK